MNNGNSNEDAVDEQPSDLIQLSVVKNETILSALKLRFNNDFFYTSIGPILVAVNPFKWVKQLYTESVKAEYFESRKALSDSPHVFAKAHDAHFGLQFGKNQSIIISGESGAGKTESTKQCMLRCYNCILSFSIR